MATQQAIDRWIAVLDLVLVPYDGGLGATRRFVEADHPLPHEQAVGVSIGALCKPLIESWESSPPREGSDLWGWLKPAYQAARACDPTVLDPGQFRSYISKVRKAKAYLELDPANAFNAEDVLIDMEIDIKVAILTARLGHRGIMHMIDERIGDDTAAINRGNLELPRYLDLQTMKPAGEKSEETVAYSDVRAVADSGVATLEQYLAGDTESDGGFVRKYFASQWVTHVITQWDEVYRKQLAQVYGCSTDDINSELFADLNRIRQAYVHNRGIATSKVAKNNRLKWFKRKDVMVPTHEDYEQLYSEIKLEISALMTAPAVVVDKTQKAPGSIPVELAQEFERHAADAELGVSAALQEAITGWIESRKSSGGS